MKKLVLIVDDDPSNGRLLASMVKVGGYDPYIVNTGEAALNYTFDTPPDIILLDIKMPHMDGITVCQHLRDNEITADIPVIFVTAIGNQIDKHEMDAVGAQELIIKPVSVNNLLEIMKKYI